MFLLLGILLQLLAGSGLIGSASAWDEPMEGVASRYTAPFLEMLRVRVAGPPLPSPGSETGSPVFQCIDTEGAPLLMGFEQQVVIEAPMEAVSAVIERMERYPELFSGLAEVQVERQSASHWSTRWEQRIPLLFVPNIHYQMEYVIGSPIPGKRLFRYQLKASGDLKSSDGAVLLETLGTGRTLYSEWDFYEADWGIAATFGRGWLWRRNAEGVVLSTLAIKAKSEKPGLTESQARELAETWASQQGLDFECRAWLPPPAWLKGPGAPQK